MAGLPADIREQIAPLGYLADAPIPQPLLAALTGLDAEGLGPLLTQCSRQSILTMRHDQVFIHALTTAAIAATNDDGALRITVDRGQGRLASINLDDPVALRSELAHHEQLYARAVRRIGAEDPSVLSLAISLALAYRMAGRLGDALRLNEETLAARERLLGSDHPDTLESRNNLAGSYLEAGLGEEALPLFEETLAARERVLGPDHPDTLSSRSNLSATYWDVGRREESNRLDEQTLAARERVLGPEHPRTLTSRNNLAVG